MGEEKSVFCIIQEIDNNILKQQEVMAQYSSYSTGYDDALSRIKYLLRQRKQILKMNKKYGLK